MLRHDEWYTKIEHTQAGGRRFDDGVDLLLARDATMNRHTVILRSEDALCVYDELTTTRKEIKCPRAQDTTEASSDD